MKKANRYQKIIEKIFRNHYRSGMREFEFEREEIIRVARQLRVDVPKNIGDLIYTFRYRGALPESIRDTAPDGESWLIRPAGASLYLFVLGAPPIITPNPNLAETKIPDSTPGIIEMYALTDEQALLAKLRYNRIIDIFTGLTCYSLQNHLRTTVATMGQVETDELYVGIDRKGSHYVLPIQAKGKKDQLNVVQVEQDIAMCAKKYPSLPCRPLTAQFMNDTLIALFELALSEGGVVIVIEKHYRLVPSGELSEEELKGYGQSSD